ARRPPRRATAWSRFAPTAGSSSRPRSSTRAARRSSPATSTRRLSASRARSSCRCSCRRPHRRAHATFGSAATQRLRQAPPAPTAKRRGRLVANAPTGRSTASSPDSHIGHEDDVLRLARFGALVDLEAHDLASAAADRPLFACEAGASHGKPLALVGPDETVVLDLVEPEHLSLHGESFRWKAARSEERRVGTEEGLGVALGGK